MKTISITIFVLFAFLLNTNAQRNGKHAGDSLSKFQIKQSGLSLIPILEDFDFDVYARIRSFVVSYNQNNQFFETKIKGNILPKEQVAALCKLSIGTRVNFDNIEVLMPDETIRNINTYYYVKR